MNEEYDNIYNMVQSIRILTGPIKELLESLI